MRISQFAIFGLFVSYQANLFSVSLCKICLPGIFTEAVEDVSFDLPKLTETVNEFD
jgi:hypothetical protein